MTDASMRDTGDEGGTATRRRLLKGGAAAVGATALAAGLGTKAASAADGGPMLIGNPNTGSTVTKLTSTSDVAFEARSTSTTGTPRGLLGIADVPNGRGVQGFGPIGVEGQGATAVAGFSFNPGGTGVLAISHDSSSSTVGLQANTFSPNGFGVRSDAGPGIAGKFAGSGTGAPVQVVLELESDTAPQQVFRNTASNTEWFFAMTSDNQFKISKNGTGTVEAKFFDNGNLQIAGTLIQASDVAIKTEIEPADTAAVLRAVTEIDIATWQYKTDLGVTHLGPMAQDFKAAFGLGHDEKSIASVDADGVALAAIQGLNNKLEFENARLRADLDELRQMVQALAEA